MNDVTVVIPHYYKVREPNLARIVGHLNASANRPAEIIIWNNESEPIEIIGATIVTRGYNVGPQARLLGATLARSPYVLFMDNDVSVYEETITNLVRWAKILGGVVTCEGRVRPEDPRVQYSRWPKVYGHSIKEPQRVFLSLARGELVERSVVLEVMQRWAAQFSLAGMDDLWFSACLARLEVKVHVVPCVSGVSDLMEMPMGGVGLCKQPDWNQRRNEAITKIGGVL